MSEQLRQGRQLRLDEDRLPDYLASRGIVPAGTRLAVEPAGDGNINWVRRARADDGRSWIVKQARLALERFPEYRVSTDRIVFEHRYYERVRRLPEATVCPQILDFDECERVLVMEDLGDAERLDHALARGADVTAAAVALGRFLGAAHATTTDPELAGRFANHEMRRLHGEHIFELPLRANEFPLAPGLAEQAARLRADAELVAIADRLHARYQEPRGALVHGDVQAGNVLLGSAGPKLLDAEIAHVGDPAFDLGVLVAHLLLPAAARRSGGELATRAAAAAVAAHRERLGDALDVPFPQVARYAGIELLRRTLGAARVPAAERGDAARAILELAGRWLRSPPDQLPPGGDATR